MSVWGLSGPERLRRQLSRIFGTSVVAGLDAVPPGSALLLLRGDFLYDMRVLRALIDSKRDVILVTGPARTPVAVLGRDGAGGPPLHLLRGGAPSAADSKSMLTPQELAAGFDKSLRKNEAPWVYPIRTDNQPSLEQELFDGAYKGVTDLVTRWLWPRPAFLATKLCVRLGLSPNQVTLCGLALAVLAGVAFWRAHFGLGLLLGWCMTFLDTVDGKLARVTVSYSRFGDVLDHGLDLIHPPLWYLAWGMGLDATWTGPWPVSVPLWLMFAGYLGGRLCEGSFQLLVAPFSMFLWRPLDSFNRLITARRNPNLLLLTGTWYAGRPDLGLWLVAIWHGLSALFLAIRWAQARSTRRRNGPLKSWLETIDPIRDRDSVAVRMFTRRPAEISERIDAG